MSAAEDRYPPGPPATPAGPLTRAEAAGLDALLARGYVPVSRADLAATIRLIECWAPRAGDLLGRLRAQLQRTRREPDEDATP